MSTTEHILIIVGFFRRTDQPEIAIDQLLRQQVCRCGAKQTNCSVGRQPGRSGGFVRRQITVPRLLRPDYGGRYTQAQFRKTGGWRSIAEGNRPIHRPGRTVWRWPATDA